MKQASKRIVGAAALAFAWLSAGAASAEDCPRLHEQLTFCAGQPVQWERLTEGVPREMAIYLGPEKSVGKVLLEEVASPAAVTGHMVQRAILDKVRSQIAGLGGEMEVVDLTGMNLADRLQGTILYEFVAEDRPILTLHSYLVSAGLVVQFITATPDTGDRAAAEARHRTFLSAFRLEAPEAIL